MIGSIGIEDESAKIQNDLDMEIETKSNIEEVIDFYYKIKQQLLQNNQESNNIKQEIIFQENETSIGKSKPIPIPKPNW